MGILSNCVDPIYSLNASIDPLVNSSLSFGDLISVSPLSHSMMKYIPLASTQTQNEKVMEKVRCQYFGRECWHNPSFLVLGMELAPASPQLSR